MRRGVLLCCDITSTIRRLYDPNSEAYEALRAENSRKMKERWAGEWGVKMRAMMKTPEFREKVSKGASRRSGGIAVVAPSRHRRASSAGEEVVGGLFFDFEAVWTVGGLFFDFEAVWTDVFTCDLEHISTSSLV